MSTESVINVPERPRKIYFGGKSPKAIPWYPLPYMEEYLQNLQIDECSAEYIRPIRVALAHFATFAKTEGIRHPEEITRQHILLFQAYLQAITKQNGEPLSLAYRQQLMKYLRTWVNWMIQIEHIERNPWIRIKVGTVKKKPKPLEDDEIARLFESHRNQAFIMPPFSFHRREVIIVLLYGWGLRIHELHSINMTHMDARQDWVTVRNKGGGKKVMPYGQAIKDVVQRWMRQRVSKADYGEDALLIDQFGKRLSIDIIRKTVSQLGDRAGISINPHRLRDTFGTTMLDNDVEIERIMALMGHKDRAQTLAYARLNNPKLSQAHDRVITPLLTRLLNTPMPPPPVDPPPPTESESYESEIEDDF